MPFTTEQRKNVVAVIFGTLSERFNVIWFGTVIALDATNKGISKPWIGWWLCVGNAASWITCTYLTGNFTQFFPQHPERAPFALLNSSAILLGVTSLIFGLVGYLEGVLYIVGNFASIIIRQIFSAVASVAINTVIILEFKGHVEMMKMYTAIAYTGGCVLSIAIAYIMYQIASSLFFSSLATSLVSLAFCVPVFVTMPKSTTAVDKVETCPKKLQETKWSVAGDLLKIPEVYLALICQMWVFSTLSAHGPLHAPFLQTTFQLEPWEIGAVSCTPFISMTIGSAFFGTIGKSLAGRKVSLILTLFLLGTSMLCEGPDPLFCGIKPNLYLHVISLLCSAFSFSSHLVLTAEEIRHAAEVHGMSQNLAVSCALGSLLTASEYASGLMGPLLGGYLGGYFGFGRTLGIMGFICYILGFVRLAFLIKQDRLFYRKEIKTEFIVDSLGPDHDA